MSAFLIIDYSEICVFSITNGFASSIYRGNENCTPVPLRSDTDKQLPQIHSIMLLACLYFL